MKYAKQYRYAKSQKGKAAKARFEASEKGKATRRVYAYSERGRALRARYLLSDRGQCSQLRRRRKFDASEKGKEAHGRFSRSRKGRLVSLRNRAIRRAQPFTKAASQLIAVWYREQAPCNWCGKPHSVIDHVLALALGRLLGIGNLGDVWNIQPLCNGCHTVKTALDVQDIRRLRRRQDGNG